MTRYVTPLATRLAANCERLDSGCLVWTGSTVRGGYGVIRIDGRNHMVHRAAWATERGPVPPGMKVCHSCDNPPCFAIEHLFLGTQRDNIRDMVAKGRNFTGGAPGGEAHHWTKLSDADVAAVAAAIASGEPVSAVAKRFGIHRNHAYRIKAGYRS